MAANDVYSILNFQYRLVKTPPRLKLLGIEFMVDAKLYLVRFVVLAIFNAFQKNRL